MGEQETNTTETPPSGKIAKQRWGKLVFLLVVLAAVAVVYLLQRRGPSLKGWNPDLDAALQQAQREDRQLLVFFMYSPPGETARSLATTTLTQAQNRRAIQEGRFLQVKVLVESLQSELAQRYRLRALPTMMVLAPSGKELNRREGFIGEVAFRRGFLDLSEIQKP